MKLMFASDIHGSKNFCEKLLVRYMDEAPEKLILLGDILNHGPRNDLPSGYDPQRVSSLLNLVKYNVLCIRGNCDSEADQMMLNFPILADYSCIFVDGISMYLTHGHTYNIENPLPMCEHDVMIYGHSHVPMAFETEKGLFLNPGSVSLPKENSVNSYLLYENGVFSWRDLNGKEFLKYEF